MLSAGKHLLRQAKHMEIGDLIRSERNKKGWSQRALAKALGISGGAVAQWELGTSRPSLARVIDICAVFGISAQSFLSPGSPYYGQIVEDAEELALLTLWRRLAPSERRFMLKLLQNSGLPTNGDGDVPEPERKIV